MPRIVDPSKCVGCGACVNVCPVTAIAMEDQEDGSKKAKVNAETCIDCASCEAACPQTAISEAGTQEEAKPEAAK